MSTSDELLGQLLFDPDAVVAFGGTETTAGELRSRAGGLAALLPASTPGSEVTFAFGNDYVAFTVALLATWIRGHTAALPCDGSRDQVVPVLGRRESIEFLHDTGVGRGVFVPRWLAEERDAGAPAPAGGGECAPRTLLFPPCGGAERCLDGRALARELDAWSERLALPPHPRIASLLPPSHPLAFLAGVLLPLRAGGRFAARRPRDLDQALELVRAARAQVLVLAESRARELARLPAGVPESLESVLVVDRALDARSRGRLEHEHGVRVVDGVEPAPWDGLVEALLAHPEVRDAAAVVRPGSGGTRTIHCGVAAPAGVEDEVEAIVAAHAGRDLSVESCLLADLPRDADGLLSDTALFLAGGFGRDGRDIVRTLHPRELACDGIERRFALSLPIRYAYFEGHFPGHPVLAGAVQLDRIVIPCARTAWPELGALSRASALKFSARIDPGDAIEVVLRERGPGELDFEVERDGLRCSSGRLRFTLAPPEAG